MTMTICVANYENADGLTAEICYEKYEKIPYMRISEPINPPFYRTIYKAYYKTEKNAEKAIKAYAKRHCLQEFRKVEE